MKLITNNILSAYLRILCSREESFDFSELELSNFAQNPDRILEFPEVKEPHHLASCVGFRRTSSMTIVSPLLRATAYAMDTATGIDFSWIAQLPGEWKLA